MVFRLWLRPRQAGARRPACGAGWRVRSALRWGRLVVAALVLAGGCERLDEFTGTWEGALSPDPRLQHGFSAEDRLTLEIAALDAADVDMSVRLPGNPERVRFESIRRAASDALGSMSLPGGPLRSYFGYLRPPGQEPYLMVLTLFAPGQVEARVIRGPDETYGVFRLSKLP